MKNKVSILLLCFAFLMSCTHDDSNTDVEQCSDNPLEELPFLKELVDSEHLTDNDGSGLEIIQYTYQNQIVFWVDTCVNNCSDSLITVYDCDENVICEFGGIVGLNTCPDFDSEARDKEVLFTTRNSVVCDKNVIIDKDLYNSTSASPIQDIQLEGDCLSITFSILASQDPLLDVDLIDSGDILESFPIQRNLKLMIEEGSELIVFVNETISFDISNLAEEGETVLLNIQNFEDQIEYTREP